MDPGYFQQSLNMDRICRVCLSESNNLAPIFCIDQGMDDFSGLPHKITLCGSVHIDQQDGLPSLICDVCVYKASVAYEFRQLCQNSDTKLRAYYNKPAHCNRIDCSTQTDPQTRIIITRTVSPEQQQHKYFLKENVQSTSTTEVQDFIEQATNSYIENPSTLSTEQIEESEEKLFMCSIEGLQEGAGVENIPEVPPGPTIEEKILPLDDHTENLKTCDDGSETYFEESLNNIEEGDEGKLEDEEEQEEEEEEEKNVLTTRSSSRKIKPTIKQQIYSDEGEFEDAASYYDQNNGGSRDNSSSRDSEELKFKCKICSKKYGTQKGLKKHSLVHEKKFKCDICLKMFYKEENMQRHRNIHSSKPHACQLCHACFSKPQGLVRHLKSHAEKVNDIIKKINTDDPKEMMMTEPKKELKIEEETDENQTTTITANNSNEAIDEFENAPELYKCDVCSQYCSSLKNLKRHALVHGDKKYSCTVCKKWFFRPDTLKKHAEKHGHGLLDNLADDNKLYTSDEESFPSNHLASSQNASTTDNENHNKKDESDEESSSSATGLYKCQHCDKTMHTKKGLRRHVSMHKPKAEPVTCEICKKVCASQARLVLHQRTHKPKEKVPREYLCHICSKVYPSNSSLTYHMRTHTGVKPHVCKTCNSGFTTTTSLANHIRIHTGDKPFVCHVCSAAFAVSSAFRRHLTRHTGEANYRCETCGKAFKRLSTLKEHTYTHSGEKPYVCKTCGAAYSHSGSLFAHQKRCRVHFGEMVVDNHHHTVTHHIHHVNNVQSNVRPLTVIGQIF